MAIPFNHAPKFLTHKLTHGVMAVALAANCATTSMFADEPQAKQQRIVVVRANDEGQVEANQENQQPPKLWLGIMLKSIEGDLATYLQSEKGVLVESVFPKSPAESAGLQKGDIVLKFDSRDVEGPDDIVMVMRSIGGEPDAAPKELSLTVLRKGDELQLNLTPTPRPKEGESQELEIQVSGDDAEGQDAIAKTFSFSFAGDQPFEEVQAMLEKLHEGGINKEIQIFQLGNPAMRLGPDGEVAELTGKMEVVIRKNVDGKQLEVTVKREDENPAKVSVKSDDEVTEYTADHLEDMPAEIREIVEPILKQKGNRVLSFKAGGLNLNAAINEQEVKEMVNKYQKIAEQMQHKAKLSAEELQAHALEVAKEAQAIAGAASERKASDEVDELRKLVDDLRAELKALRQKLENK